MARFYGKWIENTNSYEGGKIRGCDVDIGTTRDTFLGEVYRVSGINSSEFDIEGLENKTLSFHTAIRDPNTRFWIEREEPKIKNTKFTELRAEREANLRV